MAETHEALSLLFLIMFFLLIVERMMLLLQCMLITIHRQEKRMFSCLLFTREGVDCEVKNIKRFCYAFLFEWHPSKFPTLISFN